MRTRETPHRHTHRKMHAMSAEVKNINMRKGCRENRQAKKQMSKQNKFPSCKTYAFYVIV